MALRRLVLMLTLVMWPATISSASATVTHYDYDLPAAVAPSTQSPVGVRTTAPPNIADSHTTTLVARRR